jgi:hypothetical protein
MRISDLLRKVADLVDKSDAASADSAADMTPVATDNTDNTDTATMIPPLQQKHELLKKVSDVSNHTDRFDDPMDDGSPDELETIKKIAGLTNNDHGCNQEQDPAKLALHFMSDDHESD